MKYFWFYAIGSIVIMIVCSYIVTIRETFETNLKYENVISNLDVEYHKSEDQIREDNKHKMNVLYVKGDNGKPIGINMESTQTFPTYNPPGHFPYGAQNYVPTYKDAVMLPLAQSNPTNS